MIYIESVVFTQEMEVKYYFQFLLLLFVNCFYKGIFYALELSTSWLEITMAVNISPFTQYSGSVVKYYVCFSDFKKMKKKKND